MKCRYGTQEAVLRSEGQATVLPTCRRMVLSSKKQLTRRWLDRDAGSTPADDELAMGHDDVRYENIDDVQRDRF